MYRPASASPDTQTLTAIAEMSDGTYWSDSQEVIVTLAACLEDLI